ncbi:MAG: PIN domain-containing protein, partial [Candidatus Omnitrophica bacterium]|nr:PIN domain-containing protein [Candidatus Omnitrophota bacterium]
VYQELQEFFRALTDLPVTDEVWRLAEQLAYRSRRAGLPRLAPDLIIAAAALKHQVPLWHCDRDFEQLKRVEPALKTYWHPHHAPGVG